MRIHDERKLEQIKEGGYHSPKYVKEDSEILWGITSSQSTFFYCNGSIKKLQLSLAWYIVFMKTINVNSNRASGQPLIS